MGTDVPYTIYKVIIVQSQWHKNEIYFCLKRIVHWIRLLLVKRTWIIRSNFEFKWTLFILLVYIWKFDIIVARFSCLLLQFTSMLLVYQNMRNQIIVVIIFCLLLREKYKILGLSGFIRLLFTFKTEYVSKSRCQICKLMPAMCLFAVQTKT